MAGARKEGRSPMFLTTDSKQLKAPSLGGQYVPELMMVSISKVPNHVWIGGTLLEAKLDWGPQTSSKGPSEDPTNVNMLNMLHQQDIQWLWLSDDRKKQNSKRWLESEEKDGLSQIQVKNKRIILDACSSLWGSLEFRISHDASPQSRKGYGLCSHAKQHLVVLELITFCFRCRRSRSGIVKQYRL